MKTVILAGGLGSRLSEETKKIPKPMVKIGKDPILLHILRIYDRYSIRNFIICTGYKNHIINNFFLRKFNCKILKREKNYLKIFIKSLKWNIEFFNSGLNCATGGRLLMVKKFLIDEEDFCLTYGDGLSNVNIKRLIELHKKKKRIATVTAVIPPARYGTIKIFKNSYAKFQEKFDNKNITINGGFFVFNKKIFKILKNRKDSLEKNVLEKISNNNNLIAYKHLGFWKAIDTLRDKIILNNYLKNKNFWLNKYK
jgi:glucose-1-phosphate cytidylyltransferase